MADSDVDWNELEALGNDLYFEHAEDKEYYGLPYNIYNPELHIACMLEGATDLDEVKEVLSTAQEIIEELQEVGWELSEPVNHGMVVMTWAGQGRAPTEYSMFGPDGYDLDGNTREDFLDEDEEVEECIVDEMTFLDEEDEE